MVVVRREKSRLLCSHSEYGLVDVWSCAAFFRWAARGSVLGISSSPSALWVCPPIAFARPLCVVTLAFPASSGTMGCKLCNDSPLVSVSWSSIADLKTTVVCEVS